MPDIASIRPEITWREKLFLALVVPTVLLSFLELSCRALKLYEIRGVPKQGLDLEMPTWMQLDKNLVARSSQIKANEESLAWLSLFEEGPGFRVRLIPGIERSVVNTFSLLPSELDKKYHIKSNSLGFRSPEVVKQKSPDTFRIAVFGDSSSFGWGVNQDESYSALLPGLLADKINKKIEVVNFAIPGDSSEYGRLIFDAFFPNYKADLVILGFGANDAKKTFFAHQSQVANFKSNSAIQYVKYIAKYSALFRTLESLLTTSSKQRSQLPKKKRSAVGRKRFVQNLHYMSSMALKNGAKNALLLSLCTPGNYAQEANNLAIRENLLFFNGQQHLLRQINSIRARQVHPTIVDQMQIENGSHLTSNPLFYVSSDACHPNKLGHLLVAEKLAEIISSFISTQSTP